MISKRTKYGLKALQFLAEHQGKGPILIAELAQKERIPKKFLELILLDLRNNGILQSKKGKHGGYSLAHEAKNINLGNVMRILEGPIALLPCASQTAYERCEECVDEKTCGIRMVMREVRDATAKILDNTTVADVVEKVDCARNEACKSVMFHI